MPSLYITFGAHRLCGVGPVELHLVPSHYNLLSMSAGGAPRFVSARDSEGRMMMRLYIVRGSFFTADTGAGEQCAMDARVWSTMPEDLMWRVLQFVPAAKQFQWQLVSRKWRQVLTSDDFRKGLVTTATARSGRVAAECGAEQRAVIAYVTPKCSPAIHEILEGGGGSSNVKVVDIDLSFVPSWFWRSDSYSVMAGADGLVCISNERVHVSDRPPEDNQYCVINPLTRTCKILPKVPFAPWGFVRSSKPVAITGFQAQQGRGINCDWVMVMATCDLEGAGQWRVIDGLVPSGLLPAGAEKVPHPDWFAVCNSETFFCSQLRLHLFSAAEGVPPTSVIFNGPEFLDLDWLEACSFTYDTDVMYLVAHGGSIYLATELVQLVSGPAMSCGIWRLVRSRMVWEAVAGLEMEEVHRLIRSKHPDSDRHHLFGAWGAGDHLCLEFGLDYGDESDDDYVRILVGFNLKTGTWELIYDNDRRLTVDATPLQLRPDSFLF